MPYADATLSDVYTQRTGEVFISGIQALVRLPLIQIARDHKAGLNTAGYISGYRGSPLGGYDLELQRAHSYLDAAGVVVHPAINEEMGATAIWGTQQLELSPGHNKDGVFGIWYAKGPGVDRSGDVLKHANAAGSSKHGGVLCLAGDDHGAKSSTIPHQSDHAFMSAIIPVLYPSGVREFVSMGLLGIAMSRYSGCWVAMKVIADTVESSATVDLADEQIEFVTPTDFPLPPDGLNLRWPDDRWTQDYRLQNYKGYAAVAFGRANNIDRIIIDPPRAQFGLAASGKAYVDLREALALLGVDETAAAAMGLRVLKIGMPWPLDPVRVREFSRGLQEILVVEERREMVEHQIKQHLFNWHSDQRPRIVGKFDENDKPCLPLEHEISAEIIADVLVARLERIDMPADLRAMINKKAEEIRARRKRLDAYKPPTTRLPYYCPGCPHNTSTRVPDGSRALAGIGCHYMAQWMNRNTETFTQMGGEGVPWIGISPFTSEKHVFANLGDGTYMHSGIIAIRQAIAAGANITYKILFNDAVAMTGGQAVDGQMTVPMLIHQIAAEGVKKIYLLTREPALYSAAALPAGVVIEHRDAIDRVQREVREIPGCTAIVYDQTCATELRRKRARGLVPPAPERAYINPAVCEGCGDCSDQSNCIAIDPLETEFGRKRAINQSACNSDLSCLKGFCPSFVTVSGGTVKKEQGAKLPRVAIPAPPSATLPVAATYNVAITGVGGGGVLTVGHIIGMAAHIDGIGAQVLDITGLAQKGGAVVSHVRLARDAKTIAAQRIPAGGTDLLLATDLVVAASPEARQMIAAARTRAVIDTHVTPVASFIHDRDFDFQAPATLDVIERALHEPPAKLDFHHLALHAFGDSIAANMMLVGCAYQRGWLPVSERALTRAIELNRVAVPLNLAAFLLGRFIGAFPERADELTAKEEKHRPLAAMSLADIIEHRAQHLTAYQNKRLARRYREHVAQIRRAEAAVGKGEKLTRAVAINYAKLLAYKDEYEVARLFTDPSFKAGLDETFEGKTTLAFHLAPPLLSRIDPNTGRPKKIEFGSRILSLFRVLASLKRLRGTPLDIFGYSAERRRERALIHTYEDGLDLIVAKLNADNYPCTIALASLPDMVRGFGPVKMKAIERFEREWQKLQPELLNPAPETQPAEAAE
ncbi:MAG TPA: indolepyruvate ferredoxin oxidoreductase family protein [Stellaceae bacterium]|jgi:indolepyruvate ferredoxin oxidoreductase|nr:indolepyruvate ferredoxin oxidoreductase family protein [Stellaceae bacterium]